MINITLLSKNLKAFVEKSNKKHNNYYDYSLVIYKGSLIPVKIICPNHGIFEQKPNMHVFGIGCKKCGGDRIANSKFLNKEKFLDKSIKIHGDYYDYSLVNYINTNTKVEIICPKHGIFEQKPKQHFLQQGCPSCNLSKGETIIENYLKNQGLKYVVQKTFQDCKDKRLLPFDFYLPDFNILIEYQGDQHYQPVKIFGGDEAFIKIKKHDKIKKNYCIDQGIKFIELNKNNINELQTIIRINK